MEETEVFGYVGYLRDHYRIGGNFVAHRIMKS